MASELEIAEAFADFTLNEQAIILNDVAKKNVRFRSNAIKAAEQAADEFDPVDLWDDYVADVGSGNESFAGFIAFVADEDNEVRTPGVKALVLTAFAPTVTAA